MPFRGSLVGRNYLPPHNEFDDNFRKDVANYDNLGKVPMNYEASNDKHISMDRLISTNNHGQGLRVDETAISNCQLIKEVSDHIMSMSNELSMDMLDPDLSPSSVACLYSESHYDEYDGLTRRERILLRPWLENLIDSGQVPGLEWIDKSKYIFKVPWKHRSKKSWSVEHSSVFLEWAKNTGRWREGDPEPNYAQLKTRLRCAFNKAPDIQEVKEMHKTKCEDAYKVYRFVPKKESRLGSFKKKMLIPASIKRKRCSWLSWNRQHIGPVTKLKQENDCLPYMSEIKMEPQCNSPDEYSASSVNNSVHPCNYQFDTKSSPTTRNNHLVALNSPHHANSPASETLRSPLNGRYSVKYQEQFGDYLAADRTIYPIRTTNGQGHFPMYPETVADIGRKSNDSDTARSFQNVSYERSDNYDHLPCADASYSRAFRNENCYGQTKLHTSAVDMQSRSDGMDNDGVDKNRSRTHEKASYTLAGLNPVNQRHPYLETETCRSNQSTYIDSLNVTNHRYGSNAYLELKTNSVKNNYHESSAHLNLQLQPGYVKPLHTKEGFPNGSSPARQKYLTHDISPKTGQDKLNMFNKDYEFPMVANEAAPKFKSPAEVQPNQMFMNRAQESHAEKMTKTSSAPPAQPHVYPSYRSSHVCEATSTHNFSGGAHEESHARKPPLMSNSDSKQPDASDTTNYIPLASYLDKESRKVKEGALSPAYDSKVFEFQRSDTNLIDFKQGAFLQGIHEGAVLPNKPAGTNVLDLTKKVKMAVAPFIATMQPGDENGLETNKDAEKVLTCQNNFHKFHDQVSDPFVSNVKALNLIEWERRLIERERELLARERLMSHKENNLRELELAFQLDHKADCNLYDPNIVKKDGNCDASDRQALAKKEQVCDFNEAKMRKTVYYPPPRLSPISYSSGRFTDGFNIGKWSDDHYNSERIPEPDLESDIYYSYIFANKQTIKNEQDEDDDDDSEEDLRNFSVKSHTDDALFIDNVVICDQGVGEKTLKRIDKYVSPGVLMIPQSKEINKACTSEMDDSGEPQSSFYNSNKLQSDGGPRKVLPIVDSLNRDDILHIAKLPEKMSECREGDVVSSVDLFKHSSPGTEDKKKDDMHEEVWKRRLKWLSFQGAQNNSAQIKPNSNANHWIWPNIGNLSQSQEQVKLESN